MLLREVQDEAEEIVFVLRKECKNLLTNTFHSYNTDAQFGIVRRICS